MDPYYGSRLFEFLCPYLGLRLSEVNFVVAELFSLVVAFVFREKCSVVNTSAAMRHAVLLGLGLMLGAFCFGRLVLLLIGQVASCYALMLFCPHPIMHRLVFVVAMLYLLLWHLYILIMMPGIDKLSIDGCLMVSTQKITMLAFAISDGQTADQSKLTDRQKQHAVRKVPSVLEFASYMLHFQSLLAGPSSFYTDYAAYVEGRNFITTSQPNGHDSENDKKLPLPPSPNMVVIQKVTMAVICAALYLILIPKLEFVLIMDERFVLETPFLLRVFYTWLVILLKRVMYYVPWVLGDAICNASGFGFSGYDKKGQPLWDLVTIVDIRRIETATNIKAFADNWNITTSKWLRYVCYERTPTRWRAGLTFLLSAVWHGFFPGIYFFFFHMFILTLVSSMLRRNFRPLFQTTVARRRLYDVMSWTGTMLTVSYGGLPFHMYYFSRTFHFLNSVYWFMHIVGLTIITLNIFGCWNILHKVFRIKVPEETSKTHLS